MFPWQVLAIPLLIFAAWLISNLFKPGEDVKDRPRGPRDGGRQGGPKRGTSDLDRFLAQTRQRRQAQEQQRPTEPRPAPQPQRTLSQRPSQRPTEQRPAGRGQPEQRPQRLRDPYAAPSTPVSQRPTSQSVPTGRPVLLELVPEETPQPALKSVETRAPSPTEPAAAPPVATTTAPVVAGRVRPTSAVMVQVVKLLRSPQSAAVGFVLREILDRPRCKRPLNPPA